MGRRRSRASQSHRRFRWRGTTPDHYSPDRTLNSDHQISDKVKDRPRQSSRDTRNDGMNTVNQPTSSGAVSEPVKMVSTVGKNTAIADNTTRRLDQKVHELERDNEELEHMHRTSVEALEKATAKIKSLEKTNEHLRNEKDCLKTAVKQERKKTNEVEVQLEQQIDELQILVEKHDALLELYNNATTTIKTRSPSTDHTASTQTIKDLQHALQTSEFNRTAVENKFDDLESQLLSTESTVTTLTQENQTLKSVVTASIVRINEHIFHDNQDAARELEAVKNGIQGVVEMVVRAKQRRDKKNSEIELVMTESVRALVKTP